MEYTITSSYDSSLETHDHDSSPNFGRNDRGLLWGYTNALCSRAMERVRTLLIRRFIVS